MTEFERVPDLSQLSDDDMIERMLRVGYRRVECTAEFPNDPGACADVAASLDRLVDEFGRRAIRAGYDEWLKRLTDWSLVTFRHSTPLATVKHLKREVCELTREIGRIAGGELWSALHHDRASIGGELADCAILIDQIAARSGIDLLAEKDAKFAELLTRRWSEPDADGVVEHVRDAPSLVGVSTDDDA